MKMIQAQQVSYLTTTYLGEQGEMTIPEEFREAHQLEPGAPITVVQLGASLILIPEQERFSRLCDSIASTLESAGITEEMLLSGLAETREEIARERYPDLFASEIESGEAVK
jgi:bifunctional DNA-binding transcriptional regulator/antitoxin component of YhaV-PrlF toxin-antitoxin module